MNTKAGDCFVKISDQGIVIDKNTYISKFYSWNTFVLLVNRASGVQMYKIQILKNIFLMV